MHRRAFFLLGLASFGFSACVGDTPVTPTPDASGTDAGQDAIVSNDGSADGGTFCTGQTGNVVLCEDFDQGPLAGRGWAADPTNNLPAPTTAASPNQSPPFSLHVTSTAPGDAGFAWTKLVKSVNVGAALTKSTLEADILVTTASFKGASSFTPFGFNLAAGPVPAAITVSSNVWTCLGPNKTADSTTAFPQSSWIHVSILAQRTGSTTFDVTCTVDGKAVVVTGADGTGATADRRVPLGHNTTGAMGAIDYYVDNVVLRAE